MTKLIRPIIIIGVCIGVLIVLWNLAQNRGKAIRNVEIMQAQRECEGLFIVQTGIGGLRFNCVSLELELDVPTCIQPMPKATLI